MPTLTQLKSQQGFTSGDLNTDGWIVIVASGQKLYFSDGRPYNADINLSGYHKLDFMTTRIDGAISAGTFTKGYAMTQATSGATGTFEETIGSGATAMHFIYRTSTVEFDTTNVITETTSSKTVTPTPVAEVQTCVPNARATSGTFTMTYDGQTTSAIAYNAAVATIKTALEALSNIAVDDVVVGGKIFSDADFATGLTLTWANDLGDVPMVSVTESMGGTTSIAVTETTKGAKGVTAPPHWLNWTLTTGTFPDGGSNAMVLSSGAIWMNSMYNPNQFYHTRQGDPLDLDTSQTDEAAAYYSQAADADIVGDAIINFISLKDYYTVIGCASSMWVIRGGLPRQGGAMGNLTYEVGIFSPSAWCFDDKNNLYWISLAGFHRLTFDALVAAGAPENLTLFTVPDLFQDLSLNRRTDRVICRYDKQRHGINVCVSMLDGAWHNAWFYDILHESFLPDEFAGSTFPSSFLYLDSYRGDYRGLLVGSYDGYIRKFDEDTKDDDGTSMGSYCLYGPIDLHHWTRGQGSVKEVEVTLSEGSDLVDWSIYTGESFEKVYDDVAAGETPFVSGTFSAGGVNIIYEKITGRYLGILFSNTTAAKTWEIESVSIRVTERGRVK